MRLSSCLGLSLVALALAGLSACQAPVVVPGDSHVGLSGGALAGRLSVTVIDEATGAELEDATVVVGGTSLTTHRGVPLVFDTGTDASTELSVSLAGRVTERWHGVSRASAVIALRPRSATERALVGSITGAEGEVAVGVSSPFGILRHGDVAGGTSGCVVSSACVVPLSVAPVAAHDVAVLDRAGSRLVLVRDVPIDVDGAFTIDLLAATEHEPLLELGVTLPSAIGLTEVVGVPGLSTENGVALLGDPSSGTSTLAPHREAAFAGDRLWFVARGASALGESFALDREIPLGATTVELPATFLSLPSASRAGDVVQITRDPEAALYVVESSDETGVRERALSFSRAPTLQLPVSGSQVRVRAVDADLGGDDADLELAARTATRFADVVL